MEGSGEGLMIDIDRLIVSEHCPQDDFYFIKSCPAFPPSDYKPFPPRLRLYFRRHLQEDLTSKGFGNLSLRGNILIHPTKLEEVYAAIDGNESPENPRT